MSDLLELAARVEAAEGPDRELDALIIHALGNAVEHPPGDDWFYAPEADGLGRKRVPGFTASLDAAMTLVPEGWGYEIRPTYARLIHPQFPSKDAEGSGRGSPARALAAAALRARAAK